MNIYRHCLGWAGIALAVAGCARQTEDQKLVRTLMDACIRQDASVFYSCYVDSTSAFAVAMQEDIFRYGSYGTIEVISVREAALPDTNILVRTFTFPVMPDKRLEATIRQPNGEPTDLQFFIASQNGMRKVVVPDAAIPMEQMGYQGTNIYMTIAYPLEGRKLTYKVCTTEFLLKSAASIGEQQAVAIASTQLAAYVANPTTWRVEQVRLEGSFFTDRFVYCVHFINTASSNHEGATIPISLSGKPFVGMLK